MKMATDFHKVTDLEEYKKSGIKLVDLWKKYIADFCNEMNIDFSIVGEDNDYLKVYNSLAAISQNRSATHFNFMQTYVELSHPQQGLFTKIGIERHKMVMMPTKRDQLYQELLVKVGTWEEHVLNLIFIDEDIIKICLKTTAQNIVKAIAAKKGTTKFYTPTAQQALESHPVHQEDFSVTFEDIYEELKRFLTENELTIEKWYSMPKEEFIKCWQQFKPYVYEKLGDIDMELWDTLKNHVGNTYKQTQNTIYEKKIAARKQAEEVLKKEAMNNNEQPKV